MNVLILLWCFFSFFFSYLLCLFLCVCLCNTINSWNNASIFNFSISSGGKVNLVGVLGRWIGVDFNNIYFGFWCNSIKNIVDTTNFLLLIDIYIYISILSYLEALDNFGCKWFFFKLLTIKYYMLGQKTW